MNDTESTAPATPLRDCEPERETSAPGGRKDPPACSLGIGHTRLLNFLIDRQRFPKDRFPAADLEVENHLGDGCSACNLSVRLIYATNPHVAETLPSKFRAHRPLPPAEKAPLSGTSEEQTQDYEGFARKLAKNLKKPAPPFGLKRLDALATMVVDATNAEEAAVEASFIAAECRKRYERVSADLKSKVQRAGEQLLKQIVHREWGETEGQPDQTAESDSFESLSAEAKACFLLYFMGRKWFLNPGGPRLWELRDGGNTVLKLEHLKEALRGGVDEMGATYKQQPTPARPETRW